MLFIGDVHGKFNQYHKIIENEPESIQVGDMGVGFYRYFGGELKPASNPSFDKMSRGNHRFIRGNHDNPQVCRNQHYWIPDGHVENDMMFIGGAYSIDKAYRTEGHDWWPDEELSPKEFESVLEKYKQVKPKIMVTHDCPWYVYPYIHSHHIHDNDAITPKYFDKFFMAHQPEIWIHGHHHIPSDKIIEGTRFICLQELGTFYV